LCKFFPNKEDSKVCRQWDPTAKHLGLINCSRKYFKILLTRNMQVLIYGMGRTNERTTSLYSKLQR
jgi:hypothetical protein